MRDKRAGFAIAHKGSADFRLRFTFLAFNRQIARSSANESSLYFRGGEHWFLKILIINIKSAVGLLSPDTAVVLPLGSHAPTSHREFFHPTPPPQSWRHLPEVVSSGNRASRCSGDKCVPLCLGLEPSPTRFHFSNFGESL